MVFFKASACNSLLSNRVTVLRPVRLAYQPPASSIFLSEQTSHQQPVSSTFLSEQISSSHQSNEQAACEQSLTGLKGKTHSTHT
jgi:hypothetical protein